MLRRLILPKWTRRQVPMGTTSTCASGTRRRLAPSSSDTLIGNFSSMWSKTASTGMYDYCKAASNNTRMMPHNIPLCPVSRLLSTAPSSGKTCRHEAWNAKYELLQQYQKDHGDCLVPRSYSTSNGVKLGQWVNTQRKQYKKLQEGKSSPMTQERIEKLESIGFVWDALESQWNANFELLQQYKNDYGDCLVPQFYTTSNGVKLGKWVRTQRNEYKKLQEGEQSPMTQQRIEKLESIGFAWDPLETQWSAQFELLQQYQKEHGDCLVPQSYITSDGVKLGLWVKNQKQQYKKLQEGKPSSMTQERIEKLESIGFVWDALESQWSKQFELLQQYKNDYGDCLVPKSHTTSDGVKLGIWVDNQRQQYKKLQEGKPSSMTDERIEKLESIGFIWDPLESQWSKQFELLQQYQKEHGDCLVPQSYTTNDGVKLGRWVVEQRRHYKKLQDGKSSPMTQKRIEKLESTEFDWDPHNTDWQEAFQKHIDWMDTNGHRSYIESECTWRTSKGTYLGRWAENQRKQYWRFIIEDEENDGHITLERIQTLNTIGFSYDPRRFHQDQAFELLKEFKEIHGHCDIPLDYVTPSGIKYGIWISTLRSQYRCFNENGRPFVDLADGYIDIYQKMGFKWDK